LASRAGARDSAEAAKTAKKKGRLTPPPDHRLGASLPTLRAILRDPIHEAPDEFGLGPICDARRSTKTADDPHTLDPLGDLLPELLTCGSLIGFVISIDAGATILTTGQATCLLLRFC
jgi:hypothetical protein